MIVSICGGEVTNFDIQLTKKPEVKKILFNPNLASKTIGIQIKTSEIIKILQSLGFKVKQKGKNLNIDVPSWRPDVLGQIDLVEEIIRIKGFDKIQSVEPEKRRLKPTLNFFQRHFHLAKRSVASKGYLEAITWSFTDEKINNKFRENNEEVKIVNPISSDLNVLRSSLYPNIINYLKKNIDRNIENQSLFEIGPCFTGKKPGQQITVICGVRNEGIDLDNLQKFYEKETHFDVFGIKKDVVKTLVELGIDKSETTIDVKTPSYYHPGKSGSIITKNDNQLLAYFGVIHPKIIVNTYGFEIFLENLVKYKRKNKKNKSSITFSDYQKSDRDFAFVVEKDFKAQELIEIISNVNKSLIKNVKIFDVYEGENIPSGKKSIALKVTIQSDFKTLQEKDLNQISQKIISNVEEKASAKLRS
jgi:phenylalanyl-tRNA synthetase beta chain